MYNYSSSSKEKLESCDILLQKIFNEVIKYYNCSILCGHRSKIEQDKAYIDGKSKLFYPNSKHNKKPSQAIDAAPYPIDWNDISRFYIFGGYVKAVADVLGIPIIWGGDWDNDTFTKDNKFNDLVHFEIDQEKISELESLNLKKHRDI